uniref:Transcriptional regulator, AraC family n=1 Tax=Sphingobacterium sp. (strain 21) TaxID=743722 RepID=F4CE68_SPHS2
MKVYPIKDIIPEYTKLTAYYVGIFEDTPDPDIEWPHRHACYSFVWFTQGSGINVIDFDEYEILPNRVFMMNPKQIHNWNYSMDSRGYFLLIEEPLARQLDVEFSNPFIDLVEEDVYFIEEIFKRMIVHNNQQMAIPYLFSLLLGSEDKPQGRNDITTRFKKLVTENIDKNYAIEQYAEKLGSTTELLSQACKADTGLTAKQLQLDLKMTEAKRLMLYSSLNASEIAFRLGFEDSSYFARIFKKKANFSPAEFREKYLKNGKKS